MRAGDPYRGWRQWYEDGLGWATARGPGGEPQLLTGLRFDVLDLPAEAGLAVLGRGARTGPVALEGRRMRLLVAAGAAEELPGLLDWLEWRGIPLDLSATGAGGLVAAPAPAGAAGRSPVMPREAAVWLRPPEPGRRVEPTLPVTGLGRTGSGSERSAPDLVRLVDSVATACHRVRLRRGAAQPLAFS
ncbi:hypothetical protein GUY61_16400 [Streptomyces sp. GC420]|nr:hypothetical protein [Streptomyces sp. GC420]